MNPLLSGAHYNFQVENKAQENSKHVWLQHSHMDLCYHIDLPPDLV